MPMTITPCSRSSQAPERRFTCVSAVTLQSDPAIHGGLHWQDEILRMIGCSDLFVLLITPAVLASEFIIQPNCRRCATGFRQSGAMLLPVVLKQVSLPRHPGVTLPKQAREAGVDLETA